MGSFGTVIPVVGLNLGFLGQVSRLGKRGITARIVLPTTPNPIAFGAPVVIVANALSAGGAYQSVADFVVGGGTFTAAKFSGVAIREVQTNVTAYLNMLTPSAGVGVYGVGRMCEVLEEGSLTVGIAVGTAATQGPVFIRTALNGAIPLGTVGDFEAAADGGNTVSLAGIVEFRTGLIDANGVAEITLLNRVAA